MEVKETRAVLIDEVIGVLEDKKASDLTYEQQLALQHAKKFSAAKAKAEKLRKELSAMGISDRSAIKMLEIMPKSAMTIRQILAPERKNYSDEEVNKMLSILKEK